MAYRARRDSTRKLAATIMVGLLVAIVVLAAGLTVMAAAVAKLFLFDLAALDGVFRVAAFIVIGLVLLGLGVSYAQRVGDHDAPTPAA